MKKILFLALILASSSCLGVFTSRDRDDNYCKNAWDVSCRQHSRY